MPKPISKPTYRFAKTGTEVFQDLPIAPRGHFVVEEPKLRAIQRTACPNFRQPMVQRPALLTAAETLAYRDRLGGKMTFIVYCYGDFPKLHKRCLDSILKTVSLPSIDLRVAAVDVGPQSLTYFQSLPISKIYMFDEPTPKYAVMRHILNDRYQPITTKYLIWFDDSAYVTSSKWLRELYKTILTQPSSVGMYGLRLYKTLNVSDGDPRSWIKKKPWFKDRLLRNRRGVEAPNGDCFHFIADWFWCAPLEVLRRCDIPDVEATTATGDIIIGEQLWQNGYRLKTFNEGMQYIRADSHLVRDRQIESKPVPWLGEVYV